MNPALLTMQQHRSIRSYQDKPIEDAVLENVLKAAWHGPTSIHGQQITLIVTKDAAKRKAISQIAGGQPWIAQAPVFITVVVDFYKTRRAVEKAGSKQVIHESVESFGVGAVDAGITLGNLMTAARAEGLGIVPIGGIRRDPQAMIDLLNLPELTFPLVGLCMGYSADDGDVKPRLPFDTFVQNEAYDKTVWDKAVPEFDETILNHWKTVGRADGDEWSKTVRTYYERIYFPEVLPVARAQGFGFDK